MNIETLDNDYRNVKINLKEISQYIGISTSRITKQLEQGKSLAVILDLDQVKQDEIKDHLGNTFCNKQALARYWNIEIKTDTHLKCKSNIQIRR